MTYTDWSTIDAILILDSENHLVINFLITCLQDCWELKKYNAENSRDAKERLKNIGKINHYDIGTYTISKLVGLIDNHREPYNCIALNAIEILPEIPPRSSKAKALQAIPKAIALLETWLQQERDQTISNYEYLHSIKLLGEISPQNAIAIKHLENLIENCQDENDRRYLIEEYLIKIEPTNFLIFAYYWDIIENKGIYQEDNPEGIYGGQLSEWLEKSEPNNFPTENIIRIIEIIIKWINSLTPEEYLWIEEFCQWLGKVDYTNILKVKNRLIKCLINRLKIQQEPQWGEAQTPMIKCLGKIAHGSRETIEYLASCIENSDNGYCKEEIIALGNIANVDNINFKNIAIDAIIAYVEKSDYLWEEDVENCCHALTKIDTEKQRVINIFIDWINNRFNEQEDNQKIIIKWLGKVANKNESAIKCILSWMNDNNDYFGEYLCERSIPIEALANIDSNSELVVGAGAQRAFGIASFINNIDSTNAESWLNNYDDSEEGQEKLDVAINALIQIGRDNEEIINALANVIRNIESNFHQVYEQNIDILLKIDINNTKIIEVLFNSLNNPDSWIDLKEKAVDYLFLLYQKNIKNISNLSSATEPEKSVPEEIDQWRENHDEIIDKLTNLLNINQSDFLRNILNNNDDEIIGKIIKFFHKNGIYHPNFIDIICNLISDQEIFVDKISNDIHNTIFEYLGDNELAKTTAIKTLNLVIRNKETDYYSYEDTVEWLIKTFPTDEKVIDLLFYLTQPHSEDNENLIEERTQEELKELWINNAKDKTNINKTIQSLENFLETFNNDFKTTEAILLLFQLAPDNNRALDGVLFLIQQENIKQKTIDKLIEILATFHRKDILKKGMSSAKLERIVTVISQLLNNFSPENYQDIDTYHYYNNIYKQILWYCTQNLSYPDFYRAWTLPSNYEKIMVFVLLYKSSTENEGIHTVQNGSQNIVLMFESEEDAVHYALRLEAQDFPKPSVELIDREEVERFCTSSGYQWEFITQGMSVNPPVENKEQIEWNQEGD